MAMFIKVLVITMVASNFLGFSSRVTSILPFLGFLSFMAAISSGDSRKTATSVPDMHAEQNKRKIIPTQPIIRL